jgi:predicted ATPase
LEEFGFVEKRTIEYEKDLPDDIQNKFLIETHSEHMIRRLQVLIANGELSNDDVAIYYVDKNRLGNSFVKEYKINERGFFIEPWPEGFFDSTSKSLMELWKPR